MPSEISLAEIVEALDGPLTMPKEPKATYRRRIRADAIRLIASCDIWAQVRQAELGVLSAITLKDLVDRHQQFEQDRALMYHI